MSGQGGRSAFYQIAQELLYAGVLAGIIFFADRARLAAQFELEQTFLQLVEAALNFAIHFRDRVRRLRNVAHASAAVLQPDAASTARVRDSISGRRQRKINPSAKIARKTGNDGPFQAVETGGQRGRGRRGRTAPRNPLANSPTDPANHRLQPLRILAEEAAPCRKAKP